MPTFPPSFNQPESLAADAAGNVVIAGVYDPDIMFDSPSVRYQTAYGPSGSIESSYVAKYTPAGTMAWSLDLTSNNAVRVRDVAVDAVGNVFVLGFYSQQLRINGAVATLASSTTPCFLAKLSPAGALLWAITIEPDTPATTTFTMQRLAVDAAGNSVVQGEFDGSVTLDGTTFTGVAGKLHALVLRYNVLGTNVGKFAGYTTGSQQGRTFTGIALAPTGESYLSGRIYNTATLQFGTLPTLTGPSASGGVNYSTGFVVKLDAASHAAWLINSTGVAAQTINDVAVGPKGAAMPQALCMAAA